MVLSQLSELIFKFFLIKTTITHKMLQILNDAYIANVESSLSLKYIY